MKLLVVCRFTSPIVEGRRSFNLLFWNNERKRNYWFGVAKESNEPKEEKNVTKISRTLGETMNECYYILQPPPTKVLMNRLLVYLSI